MPVMACTPPLATESATLDGVTAPSEGDLAAGWVGDLHFLQGVSSEGTFDLRFAPWSDTNGWDWQHPLCVDALSASAPMENPECDGCSNVWAEEMVPTPLPDSCAAFGLPNSEWAPGGYAFALKDGQVLGWNALDPEWILLTVPPSSGVDVSGDGYLWWVLPMQGSVPRSRVATP